MPDHVKTKSPTKLNQGYLTTDFTNINCAGVYVTQRGEMFRVPCEAIAEGHSPILSWENMEGSLVTRISEDAYAPISKCRQLAANADLPVNF